MKKIFSPFNRSAIGGVTYSVISRIRKLRSEGYTWTAIAKIFNDEEIKTLKGFGKWGASAVSCLDRKG